MSWSDILPTDVQGWVNLGLGVGNIGSLLRSSREADRLSGMTQEQIDAGIERNNEIYDLYSEGGAVMSDNLSRLLNEYGDFGQITPATMNLFSEFVSGNRAEEEAANKKTVDGLTEYDVDRLKGMEDMFREFSDTKLSEGQDEVYFRDALAKLNAPNTLDFARMQDDLTMKFMSARQANTQQAIDNQYAKALANIPEGMENSTLRVQMERASADLAREAYNKDMIDAVGDAQNYISGLQGAASNQQNMDNAERNMSRNLVSDGLNYGTTTLANNLLGGQYGQDFYGNENAMRGRNISELGALQGMRNNTAVTDYTTAMATLSGENAMANDYISQVMGLSTAPYSYTADGSAGISNSSAVTALGNLSSNYQSLANSNAEGLGNWWSNTKSNL